MKGTGCGVQGQGAADRRPPTSSRRRPRCSGIRTRAERSSAGMPGETRRSFGAGSKRLECGGLPPPTLAKGLPVATAHQTPSSASRSPNVAWAVDRLVTTLEVFRLSDSSANARVP
jgi:hypothetical protein